jgi:hypothetical protein
VAGAREARHVELQGARVFQIQGGKTVVVHPASIKQGEFKLGVK